MSRANSVEISPRCAARPGQCPAVAAHPHHEVLGLEDVGVLVAGPGAVVALLTLGVQAHPAHPAAQVLLVDAVEALLGVDVDDAGPHVQGVVVLLELLVRVERLAIAERPLALAAWALTGFVGGFIMWWLLRGAGLRTRSSPGAVRRRRSGGQLKVQGGLGPITTSRQTTTGTNALEVDMPPRHQRDAVGVDRRGGGHVTNCATDTDNSNALNRGDLCSW